MATRSYRRLGLLVVWLASAITAFGQYQPWAVQWLQHAFNAQAGRDYLGVTNFHPGAGVTFTLTAPLHYTIAANGVTFSTNALLATNAIWATNWVGSNAMQTQITVVSNSLVTSSNVLQSQVTGLTNAFQTNAWHLNGNTGSTQPIFGTLDDQPVNLKINNINFGKLGNSPSYPLAIGYNSSSSGDQSVALAANTIASGNHSVAVGDRASATAEAACSFGDLATTSAQYATSVGASAQSTTDFSVAIGFQANASGANGYCTAIGPLSVASGDFSTAFSFATANGTFSTSIGPGTIANFDGSTVLNDFSHAGTFSDDTTDQFVGAFGGGFVLMSYGGGLNTDGPVNSTNTINAYNATGNSFTYDAQANAGVAAVQSPLGNWGFLSLTNSQLINIAVSSTYYPITNFNYAATNRFGASYVRGELTNTLAGWYRIAFNVSIAAPTANDAVDADLLINGVVTEIIASHSTAPGGVPPKYVTLSASGIQHLSAGTRVGIGITDTTGTGNATILHSQLTVGTP